MKSRLTARELKKRIAALRALDLRRTQIGYLATQLAPVLHQYVQAAPVMQRGERIFRAVRWTDLPTHVSGLTYPPVDKTPWGRVNRPGEPVFYGSVGGLATVRELRPADGQRLVVSMWRTSKNLAVVPIGYAESIFARMGSSRWGDIWWRARKPLDQEPASLRTAENLIVDEFLAREFTRNVAPGFEWKYKLSIAIGERFLRASPPVSEESIRAVVELAPPGSTVGGLDMAGIVYPSIATGANDDNVALKSRVADECLQFVWVHYLEIRRSGNIDEFTPVGIDFADSVSLDGAINWQGKFPSAVCPATDLRLSMSNNELVMIDSLGQVAGAFSSPEESPR